MQVCPIAVDDFSAARALLEAGELPTDDLADASIVLLGAFEQHELVGVIGLQTCDRVGLLRSLAVAPAVRGRGVGRVLCEHVIDTARRERLEEVWLLTTSAKDYFPRHGFVLVPRDAAPLAIRQTAQFSSLCPSTAVVMRRALG